MSRARLSGRDAMYRSNSSLELAADTRGPVLRREYGSHGSIDAAGAAGADAPRGPDSARTSPRPRLKLHRLWGGAGQGTPKAPPEDVIDAPDTGKRRRFAHYDCQSLLADLGYAAEARGALLGRRRNTTTGASAASMLARAPGDLAPDKGDGRHNQLVESCPFFRNELGGEEERCVSLCWRTSRGRLGRSSQGVWHRPRVSCGFSVLEHPPGQSHWKTACPFAPSVSPPPIESQDLGALYYRNYFYNQPHQNWFGLDENLGPVGVSVKREWVEVRRGGGGDVSAQLAWQYRVVVRTSELLTLRGTVLESSLPGTKPATRDLLEYVAPELQLSCLRLGVSTSGAEEQLLRLDEQCLTRQYKVGVMYCRAGQASEEDMYNNQEAGPAFVEFLQTLGQTVRLKGFDKYRAGLDTKSDSTGLYSVYATHQGCELMFHVSTMLPYSPNNRQQLLRKRHIGNDIVTLVFQEPGAAPFSPRHIRSQFQHVFVVVRAIDPCTDNTHYSVAVSRAKEVPLFGPPIKEGAVYPKGEAFTDLLLTKVINGENAAIQSPKFSTMATRTRQEYLKDLARNYVTPTTLDTGQKFSLFSSLLMKGGVGGGGGGGGGGSAATVQRDCSPLDHCVGGALGFNLQVEDEGAGGVLIDCVIGVSTESIVLLELATRQPVLVFPTDLLLGWVVVWGGGVRVYYHTGECVRLRGAGGAGGLLARLAAVAPPHAARLQEAALERAPSGQLGFHVQPDGLVTAVEGGGCAGRAGLRPGARLLEVCRAAVAALHHEHLVDLLKTSDPVTVTVSLAGGCRGSCSSPEVRRGDGQLPGRQRRAYEPRALSPPRSDSSGYGTGGSGRSGRAWSPALPTESPRRDQQQSPRHRHKRHAANTNSLTEELMRYMDAELGPSSASPQQSPPKTTSSLNGSAASPRAAPSPRALPLPDATALDWSALVHTATRAMLQMCEEHQFPSIENADSSVDVLSEPRDTWEDDASPPPVPPAPPASAVCACGLTARVSALEVEAKREARHRHQLEEEVRRLRRHNARLRDESARAVHQLRRFTQWFMHTVDRQH